MEVVCARPHDLDCENLAPSLAGIVGAKGLICDPAAMEPFVTDWRALFRGDALAVVRPSSTDEVARVAQACSRRRIAMVPQGGNTGLVGGGVPAIGGRAVIINLGRLNRIRDLDAANNAMTVEAGCILQDVQKAARAADRLFPLSFGAEGSCQIGGTIATNAGGTRAIRYGVARHLVLGLEVVLADGTVWNGLKALRKDNTGYDLKQLFVGSEGTLGIITAAVLKLFPMPVERATAFVAVRDPQAAVDLFGRLQDLSGERVESCELIGRSGIDLALSHVAGIRDPLARPYPHYLLIELTSPRADENLGALLEDVLGNAFEAGTVEDAMIAASEAQAGDVWRLREAVVEGQRLNGPHLKHDVSVPVSRIPDLLRNAQDALERLDPRLSIVAFGHVGDGNIHYNVILPGGRAADHDDPLARSVIEAVYDETMALGGSISAEHGIGQLKQADLWRRKDPRDRLLMKRIKQALDPDNVMNPGKLLDGPHVGG